MGDQEPVLLTMRANETSAVLLVGALEQEGIRAMLEGQLTSGFRAEAPGQVRVLVRGEDLERAQQVLEAFDSAGE
jgi:hypothetical protein